MALIGFAFLNMNLIKIRIMYFYNKHLCSFLSFVNWLCFFSQHSARRTQNDNKLVPFDKLRAGSERSQRIGFVFSSSHKGTKAQRVRNENVIARPKAVAILCSILALFYSTPRGGVLS